MKKYLSILFLGAVFIFIYSCQKDKPVSPPGPQQPFHLQQATKDYCLFKTGSWWLYQDSVSGIKDSVTVTAWGNDYDTITAQNNLGYTGIFETFYVLTHSTYLNYTQKVYYHSSFSQWSHRDDSKYYRYNSNYVGGEVCYFTTNFQIGFNTWYSPGTTSLGYFDSVGVGNIWYKKIAVFYNSKNATEEQCNTYRYISKNIGLLKKEIPDSNRNWLLINYNVVQ